MNSILSRPVRVFLSMLIIVLLMAACSTVTSPLPRTDTDTFLPPTGPTQEPTTPPTPSPSSYIQQSAPKTIPAGFQFNPVTTWDASGESLILTSDTSHASLGNQAGTLFFDLSFEPLTEANDTQTCIDHFTSRMNQDFTNLVILASQPRTLSGQPALATQFSGTLLNQPVTGQLTTLFHRQYCFNLLSLALGESSSRLWADYGQSIDQTLAASVSWVDASAEPSQHACQISTDPTYGTTPDNPIRIGQTTLSDALQREELYLLTLRGPGNEEIIFERLAPGYNQAEQIVDIYLIKYNSAQEPFKVYFDSATYQQPLALAGFTCEAAFPIQAP